MTSTPVILLLKRSGQASDRPNTSVVQNGELAISVGASDPGLYFEDSTGTIRKIGPSAYGTTAPNSTPVGAPGNSVGETWTDSSTSNYFFKVWTGAAWQTIGSAFATAAGTAVTANTSATSILASGTVLASGAIFSSTSTLSSGAILASGAVFASTSTLASGAVLASGAIQSATVVLSGLPETSISLSGTLVYQVQDSGTFNSGLYVRATDTWLLV